MVTQLKTIPWDELNHKTKQVSIELDNEENLYKLMKKAMYNRCPKKIDNTIKACENRFNIHLNSDERRKLRTYYYQYGVENY